ncbi:MAG: RNA pyrophosphohydrolase, partial [Pseudomonadota bacterium]
VATMRELEEEIGTNNATIIAESKDWYYYDLPSELVAKVWKGRYKGQKQKWFVMDFQGSDADINIDTAHPEFSEWKWIEPKDLPDIIVPFKRKLYQDLLEEFKQCLS